MGEGMGGQVDRRWRVSESWDGSSAQKPLTNTLTFLLAVCSHHHIVGLPLSLPAWPPHLPRKPMEPHLCKIGDSVTWAGACDHHSQHSPHQLPVCDQVALHDQHPGKHYLLLFMPMSF